MRWRRDGLSTEAEARPGNGLARRRILRGMAGGAGALAAIATSARASAEEERTAETAAPDDPTKLHYRETEHVRWFYRRARM